LNLEPPAGIKGNGGKIATGSQAVDVAGFSIIVPKVGTINSVWKTSVHALPQDQLFAFPSSNLCSFLEEICHVPRQF
jgi:hypothetical protein